MLVLGRVLKHSNSNGEVNHDLRWLEVKQSQTILYQPHQILRLPRKMTLENFRENVRKQVFHLM